jgi:hypothetical protein
MNKSELKQIIFEAYAEVLSEAAVPTSMDELLGKFPSLYRTVRSLLTDDFANFVTGIEWVSPKPSTFRVVLSNQQSFYLKWLGEGFQAQVEGKKYYLENNQEFQQALDRLSELLKHSEPSVDDLASDVPSEFDSPAPAPSEPTASDFGDEPTPPGEQAPEFGEPEA